MRTGPAAAATLMLLVGACGSSTTAGDLSDSELRQVLRENLADEPGFTSGRASCVVDRLFATTTRDQLNRISDAQELEELSQDEINLVTDAVFECLAGSAGSDGDG